jgi:hypothetical protein
MPLEHQKVDVVPDLNKFINNLTTNEVAKIERLGGAPISRIFDDDVPKALPLAAIYLHARRHYGYLMMSWDQALNTPLGTVMEYLGLSEPDQPAQRAAIEETPVDPVEPVPAEEDFIIPAEPTQVVADPTVPADQPTQTI